jgi:uncharacterized Zn-finger protein
MNKIDWSLWQSLLGTMPDNVLAKKIGCPRMTVKNRRDRLGIPVFKKEKEEERICPFCKEVFRVNHKSQVFCSNKCAASKIDWNIWKPLLGTMPDADLAKKIGCLGLAVYKKRKTLGVPAFEKHARIDWEPWVCLLGTMPDIDLAKKIGCSRDSVHNKRISLGVPVFAKSNLRPRVCRICGKTFSGSFRARRCPICLERRQEK